MDDVNKIFERIESKKRKQDAITLYELINEVVDVTPKVWDDKVIGWGDYRYINKTNEGDMPILGLVPAKAHITLYFTVGGLNNYPHHLEKIGKYRRGKICLYIANVDKIDKDVFSDLVRTYYNDVLSGKATYVT